MSDASPPPIHPGARLGPILDAYPEAEDVLFRLSPAFRRLRNPVLRRTIGRVATLEQVATVGGIDVRDLVRALRAAAGVPFAAPSPGSGTETREDAGPVAEAGDALPAWFDPDGAGVRLDADAILAAGGSPLTEAFRAARRLAPRSFLIVRASFPPEPLREAFLAAGHPVHLRAVGSEVYELIVAAAQDQGRGDAVVTPDAGAPDQA